MFYRYLSIFGWVCNLFGLHKPFPLVSEKIKRTKRWHALWSIIVISAFITFYFYPKNIWFIIKDQPHIDEVASANNLIVNVIIVLVNVYNGEKICTQIYSSVNDIVSQLHVDDQCLKIFAIKLYIWIMLPSSVFGALIITEFLYADPPYTLVVKMPIYLSTLHLVIHLSLLLASLKIVNLRIYEKFTFINNYFADQSEEGKSVVNYLFDPTIRFFRVNRQKGDDYLKTLCIIYDEIGICINLLEKYHGIQMLLSIWLMFSNAVTGITLINVEMAKIKWVVIMRSALPFFWYFIGCFVNNQLRQEVERTDLLIIKHLINFRCNPSTKEILQTFREVVSANRLEFTACNLFRLNYATILGTVVNVITYSIILIQILQILKGVAAYTHTINEATNLALTSTNAPLTDFEQIDWFGYGFHGL